MSDRNDNGDHEDPPAPPGAGDPGPINNPAADNQDAGAISVTPRPDAREDGEPQHMFFGKEYESVLEKRLMLWGGYKGIASFEGMLSKDMTPPQERAGSDRDIAFLQSLQMPKKMAYGETDLPTYRFICFPNAAYSDRMPTGLDVIRDLFNDKHFSGERDGLDSVDVAFPGDADSVCRDQMHTDRKKQYVFSHRYELEKAGENEERKAEHELSIEAHEKLESFAKDGRLYYAMFHTKKVYFDDSPTTPMAKCAYFMTVGVSPHSGNLVGVLSMDRAPRSLMPHIDDGAINKTWRPEAKADGEPQPIFFYTRDESALSKKLMLWGDHSGIVSFEGALTNDFLPREPRPGSEKDVEFLRSMELPDTMAYGCADVPIFRFMCLQETAYTDRVPTGRDVVRDLGFDAMFKGVTDNFDLTDIPFPRKAFGDDQIHTDRDKQFIFKHDDEVSEREEDETEDEGVAAHESLEGYVKDKRLYYAAFHTKKHYRNGPAMSDYVYAFAVGVSPHSGNLVGVFAMQVARNLTE